MATTHPRILVPTLQETAQVCWQPEALERCGDPTVARRLTFARYLRLSRHPEARADRVIRLPAGDEAPCS